MPGDQNSFYKHILFHFTRQVGSSKMIPAES